MLSDTLILYIFDVFREYKKSKISSAAGVMPRQRSSCLTVSPRGKRNCLYFAEVLNVGKEVSLLN